MQSETIPTRLYDLSDALLMPSTSNQHEKSPESSCTPTQSATKPPEKPASQTTKNKAETTTNKGTVSTTVTRAGRTVKTPKRFKDFIKY